MQYQGYSTKNLHQGDVRITGDLQVDGSVDINDLTINNLTVDNIDAKNITVDELKIDGYTLPTSKGDAGNVIIATGDGSTSTWSPAFEGTARVVVNKFTGTDSRIRTQAENGIILSIEQAGFGSKTYTEDEFPVGSVIVIRAYGNWSYLRSSQGFIPEGSFWLLFSNNPPSGPVLIQLFAPFPELPFAGTYPSSKGQVGNWELNIQITRVNATGVRIGGTIQTSLADSQNQIEIPLIFPQKIAGNPDIFTIPGYPFDVAVKWQDTSSQGGGTAWIYPTLCGYTQDLVNSESKIIATSANLTTDHTLLSNLTLNDAGHTQFALLQGRDNGQVLSGGITPLHDLKLKSHSIGLDNIIVKDLNTEFKKDVDMDNNNITNAKDIVDASTSNKIDMAKGGFLNTLELSSADEVKLVNTTSNNFVSASSGGLNINSSVGGVNISDVVIGNTILLNDPSLVGGLSIKSNSVGVLIQENSSTNNLGVSSGSVGMVCNSGQMNIRSTDALNNLTIAKQNGGSIELDVQSGSGVVQVKNSNLDMNFNGIVNCAFIDGLKPSGGLYSESSGFSIPSTNLTETNLLGQGASSGTLSVPANGFTALDAYSFKCSGVLSGGTNDEFTLRLKSLVDGTTPVEFGSIIIILADNGLVDVPWSVTADFTIRSLGVSGVGVLVLSGNFSYSNNNEVVRIYLRTIIDSTNFDTTLSNELQFTFQNDATNPLTSFRIDQASFTKWY